MINYRKDVGGIFTSHKVHEGLVYGGLKVNINTKTINQSS